MIQGLAGCHSFLFFPLQEPVNKIGQSLILYFEMLIIAFNNFTNSNLSIIVVKGWVASIKLECDTSDSPHVIATITWLLHHNFRSRIIESADWLYCLVPNGRPKITNFISVVLNYYSIYLSYQHIWWLNVSVNNSKLMQIAEPFQNLRKDLPNCIHFTNGFW